MIVSKKIPRIQSISKLEGFRVYCLFNTGEQRVINFEKLFEAWNVKSGDVEYMLLDLNKFQKVKLRDGVLFWENVHVRLASENNLEGDFFYEIDPIIFYSHSEPIFEMEAAEVQT